VGTKLGISGPGLFSTVVWFGWFFLIVSLCSSLLLHVLRWAEPYVLRWYVARALRVGKNQGLFCRQRIILSADGITEASDLRQSTISWRAVERVVHHQSHAYIYLNSVMAVIVPQRAFASAAEFEEFMRTAERHLANAGASPS
jgi:hypothetical protein